MVVELRHPSDCKMEHLNIADVPADMLDRYLRKLFQVADLDGNGIEATPVPHLTTVHFQESSIDKSLRRCSRKVGCSLVHRKSCG